MLVSTLRDMLRGVASSYATEWQDLANIDNLKMKAFMCYLLYI